LSLFIHKTVSLHGELPKIMMPFLQTWMASSRSVKMVLMPCV